MTPPVGGLPLGCAPGSKAGATTPVLDAASNGRFQIAPGDKLVLELTATRGNSAIAYDAASTWTIFLRART